ncbi:helix-turn-helix domain-containing protein [Sulfitobacter sp. HI0054]|uniref:helix-turn-helix domain-containing protein n=1 Tax=Sulfitobacter sp. HI0054 TaxID=1822238 RepID=UPI003FCCBDC5
MHKGYEGGVILPPLHSNETVPEAVALEIGQEVRLRYEGGESIRDLAEDTGYSIQRVRSFLNLAETQMRPRGRPAVAKSS